MKSVDGDASSFNGAGKITGDHASGARRRIVDCGGTIARACVQHDLMAFCDKRLRGGATQTVGAAGYEDASHR